MVPPIRVQPLNAAPCRSDRDFVLYWMIAYRRARYNYALERAIEWAEELRKPLLVFEPLRCGYPWASDRLHHFLLEGMAQNAKDLGRTAALYFPYVEPQAGAGKGLLAALAARSCVVLTDEFPCFMYPQMTAAAARQLDVRLEQVDSNGLLPLRTSDHAYPTAFSFRRFVQRELPSHLATFPQANPFRQKRLLQLPRLPEELLRRWPPSRLDSVPSREKLVSQLPIDHSVLKAPYPGGAEAARTRLKSFLRHRLERYGADRNEPETDGTSGLSPYLHFGHISTHEIFVEIMRNQEWSVDTIEPTKPTGKRRGWWRGLSESAEEFLDQVITWRELGFNFCFHRKDYDQYQSLPDWSQKTLKKHSRDRRPFLYTREEFETAQTHDPLWNAAQRQLLVEGRIHNYLRMLWGKKILEWSRTPEEALAIMIELNNKYALDGRDPNSYSGIFWVLGRYDRPWGPERSVFGTVRYMSSENTARKLRVKDYLKKYRHFEE